MGYGSISGRARTSTRNPQAHAICDNCGFRYNHVDLKWQFDWAGGALINKRMLVCNHCYDRPQEQLRSFSPPADPVPILNPRPENFVNAATDYRMTEGNTTDPSTGIPVIGGSFRITEDDDYRVTQQTGEAPGSLNEQPGTSETVPASVGSDDPGLPYLNEDVPETGPLE